jgi:hypothetical protein
MSSPVQYKAVNLATATPVSVTTVPSELISIRPSVVMSAHTVAVQDGALVAAVAEVVTMTGASGLTAGQTFTIAGLTFTSTGVTTQAQLLTAFASLANGATTGGGTGEGAYSGALAGYTTSTVTANVVTFTSTISSAVPTISASGTGAAAAVIAISTLGVTAQGALVATLTASSAVTAKFEYDGITLNRGIHLIPNASSTGTVIVAYRLI